jgi:hypothetical protein
MFRLQLLEQQAVHQQQPVVVRAVVVVVARRDPAAIAARHCLDCHSLTQSDSQTAAVSPRRLPQARAAVRPALIG